MNLIIAQLSVSRPNQYSEIRSDNGLSDHG